MKKLINQIPKQKQEKYLEDLLYFLMDQSGLGSVPKKDMKAYLVYLYLLHTNKIESPNSYEISEIFRTKESKIKELLELISVKFREISEYDTIHSLVNAMLATSFELESFERGQIRFSLPNSMLFRHLQYYFRLKQGTVTYHRGSEQIVITQSKLFDVIEDWYDFPDTSQKNRTQLNTKIKKLIGNIGHHIDDSIAYKIRQDSSSVSKLKKALDHGAQLAKIGSFVNNILENINSSI